MWDLQTDILTRHRAALDLGQAAVARSKAIRQELAALDVRRATLLGVAAQPAAAPVAPYRVAAGLGPRPSARGVSR
jgi:hypothetical protein